MKGNIPNELVMALASDARMRGQFVSMYLLQQEIMVAITAQLHHRGLLDVDAVAQHVRTVANAPELGDLVPDLAQAFCQRLSEQVAARPVAG